MWDERYSGEEYAYGTAPNDFLREVMPRLPKGTALCLGDGEGRNGVWLAEHGFKVTSLDASAVGLTKAARLAGNRNVSITTLHRNLQDYAIEAGHWDVIVSVFCHLPPELRRQVHAQVVTGLKTGGMFVLEAYTPKQLDLGTGGPQSAELMMNLADLTRELAGLELLHARELQRDISEGRFHCGPSAVVQLLARRNCA
ncbi:MAG TPA: class I SAM-dependent methyltransferase [Mariprofundaceae bacterium]|nr:class I SAM-dependent methyltransferase [Mariprofundaceae bacterium]